MKEFVKYRHLFFRPKFLITYTHLPCRDSVYIERVEKSYYDLTVGTFWKPIGKIIRWYLKRKGWSVKLRGRGDRRNKHHNSNLDIRIKDSVYVAVYARKKSLKPYYSAMYLP